MKKGAFMAMGVNALAYYFKETARYLVRNSWLSLAATGTITVSLLILGVSTLLVTNTNKIALDLEQKLEIRVFLAQNLSLSQVEQLEKRINFVSGVARVSFVSKEKALADLRRGLGERKDILAGMKKNPLPDAFQVKMERSEQIAGAAAQISSLPGVEQVLYGQDTVEKLLMVTRWVRIAGIIIIGALILAALFLISSIIRLSVFARRQEICIMKVLGATYWFIRTPFLLEGVVLGFFGSLVAVVILYFSYWSFVQQISTFMPFVPLVTNQRLLFNLFGGLVGLGLVIGIAGSFFSVRKYLKV
jgi:cell division transport system permease protein